MGAETVYGLLRGKLKDLQSFRLVHELAGQQLFQPAGSAVEKPVYGSIRKEIEAAKQRGFVGPFAASRARVS